MQLAQAGVENVLEVWGWNWETTSHQLSWVEGNTFCSQSFCREVKDSHIRVITHNSTTVACINKMESTTRSCNQITRHIWLWCLERTNFVLAVHILGSENVEADVESRTSRELEWKLDPFFFQDILSYLGQCEVDLFASRVNAELPRYVSLLPDPVACWCISFGLVLVFCVVFSAFQTHSQDSSGIRTHRGGGNPHSTNMDNAPLVHKTASTTGWLATLAATQTGFADLLTHPMTGNLHPVGKKLRLRACKLSWKL